MAYDTELADRIRELMSGASYTEKKMFGGLAFLIGGNMSVAASGQGGILVRADPADEALLKEPGAAPMQMGGRAPMQGWIHVAPEVLDDATLRTWVERGVAYAGSLPPKNRSVGG